MSDDPDMRIVIDRISLKDFRRAGMERLNEFEQARQSHRHDGYSFFLLEKGTITAEIDFRKYRIQPMTIVYMHPSQAHRTFIAGNITVSSWSLSGDNLNPPYLKLLDQLVPAKPLILGKETFSVIREAVDLGIKLSGRKDDKLYHSLLKDCANALVALVISQFVARSSAVGKISRFEVVSGGFRELLEKNYVNAKRPADYAQMLNISIPYLNECVRNSTGLSVSDQIRLRVILEAKRLLYHSDKSVKEIAEELGFDDYPYFTRVFSKSTGMTALAFREKNRD